MGFCQGKRDNSENLLDKKSILDEVYRKIDDFKIKVRIFQSETHNESKLAKTKELLFLLEVLKDIKPIVAFFEEKGQEFPFRDYFVMLENILSSIENLNCEEYYSQIWKLNNLLFKV